MEYVYVLSVDNYPGVRVFTDPTKGMINYINHVESRVDLNDENVDMSTDGESYYCYHQGDFVAELTRIEVE